MNLSDIKKYNTFVFDKYNSNINNNILSIEYYYEIKDLCSFCHKIEIPITNPSINNDFVDKLIFNIGMIEMINYWKLTLAENIIVKCGYMDDNQIKFFKKLYYNGLGEFLYRNNIDLNEDNFINFNFKGSINNTTIEYNGTGNMIGVGGGKDSCVSLELLKNEKNNSVFVVNPKEINIKCSTIAGIKDVISIKRILDNSLFELNDKGFLNGHIPFSSVLAFISFLAAYLNNKENIILSNESSANEANIIGTKINHQYSKSYEFEQDFREYANKYLNKNINYFSFLRGLSEYQIAMIFAKKCSAYFNVFKSCNVGSKTKPWIWCCNCSKCLFVYSLLSPFLEKELLINIFGEDLLDKKELLQTFKELLGKENIKPFDCVGTFEEINYAITKTIKQNDNNLPYLLEYYKENYYDETILNLDLENYYNKDNNIDEHFEKIVKGCIINER